MKTTGGPEYRYETLTVSRLLTNGAGGAAKALRGWARQGRIEGVYQREKNAKMWYSADGVLEAWALWANHKELDGEADMPAEIRQMKESVASAPIFVGDTPNGEIPTVTVYVPAGVAVKIVTVAA